MSAAADKRIVQGLSSQGIDLSRICVYVYRLDVGPRLLKGLLP